MLLYKILHVDEDFVRNNMGQAFLGIKNHHAERFKFSRGVGESRKMNETGLNRLVDLELKVLADRNRSGVVFMEALNSKY